MHRRAVVVLLVGVNVLLVACLAAMTWGPSRAYAQAAPMASNYVMVAAEISDGVDGLYVIDLASREMHVFVPNRNQNDRRLLHAGLRDLQRDFRGK